MPRTGPMPPPLRGSGPRANVYFMYGCLALALTFAAVISFPGLFKLVGVVTGPISIVLFAVALRAAVEADR